MAGRFDDKVMVITGAARGIGFATARMAAVDGAKVVICDLDGDAVEKAVEALGADGLNATGVAGDVSDLSQVNENVARIMQIHERIDILINNAAINSYHRPEDLPEAVWLRELAVNLSGSFFWAQTVANAAMIPARGGSIVNIGSGAAQAGIPRCASYVAAKHGVVGLTRALAVDWGQFNIRVNCVCPGLTFTDLARQIANANPQMIRDREARIPLGRGAEPEDVACAILFLASDDAGAISGDIVNVDGGTLAMSSGYAPPRGQT